MNRKNRTHEKGVNRIRQGAPNSINDPKKVIRGDRDTTQFLHRSGGGKNQPDIQSAADGMGNRRNHALSENYTKKRQKRNLNRGVTTGQGGRGLI